MTVYLCARSHHIANVVPHKDAVMLWSRTMNVCLQLVAQTGNQRGRRRRDGESEEEQSKGKEADKARRGGKEVKDHPYRA